MTELLNKIPAEICWALTAKILGIFAIMRGEKITAPILGVGEGIMSPLLSVEKWKEINTKAWGAESGMELLPWIKETFNISAEDAMGADKVSIIAATFKAGPEALNASEIVEAIRERVVRRITKCMWWERYRECEVDPEYIPCLTTCQAFLMEDSRQLIRNLILST
jgi:hypothetical protein